MRIEATFDQTFTLSIGSHIDRRKKHLLITAGRLWHSIPYFFIRKTRDIVTFGLSCLFFVTIATLLSSDLIWLKRNTRPPTELPQTPWKFRCLVAVSSLHTQHYDFMGFAYRAACNVHHSFDLNRKSKISQIWRFFNKELHLFKAPRS